MDLSTDIQKMFPELKEEISSNGNGAIKNQPQKKIISQEEINTVVGDLMEKLEEAEEIALDQGYENDSIILLFETIHKVFSVKLAELKGEAAPVITESAAAVKEQAPAAEGKKEEKKPEEKKNWLEYIYDLETMPALTCKFLGAGPVIPVEGRQLKTWKVKAEDEEKTEWLLPQWSVFNEVQGSFLGFPAEEPGKYIYQLTFRGAQDMGNNTLKFIVYIMKKFAQ